MSERDDEMPVTMRRCVECGAEYDSMGEPILPLCTDCLARAARGELSPQKVVQ